MTVTLVDLSNNAKDLVGETLSPPPSKPGEPPHVVLGVLRSAISFAVKKAGDRIVGALGVLASVPYAARLECGFHGTDSLGRNINQAPRPFLRPTVLRNRDLIVRTIAKAGKK